MVGGENKSISNDQSTKMSDSMTNQQMMAGLQTQIGQMSYMLNQQQQRQFGVVYQQPEPAGQQFAVPAVPPPPGPPGPPGPAAAADIRP